MAAAKFTEAEREKLFAQLEAPFDPALIKWRVMRTFDYGRSGAILPFADPRAYTDRLNDLFTPSGWTREYTISTVPSLCRMERGKAIVTSKILVATAVTITRLGSHTGTGEEWADRENAVTAVATNTLLVTIDLPRSMRHSDGTVEIVYSRVQPEGVKSSLSRSV